MIKLKTLLMESPPNEDINIDRLYWNDSYLDDIAEGLGYRMDFTEVFWSQHYVPTLYHCTTPENYESIKTNGLERRNERRGATSGNSRVGPAVFTTAESEEISFFQSYYGPIVIAINTVQMKKDGFMPEVSQEPDWERAHKLVFILNKLGKDAEAGTLVDSSDQNTEGTVIVYSDIPVKYLSLYDQT